MWRCNEIRLARLQIISVWDNNTRQQKGGSDYTTSIMFLKWVLFRCLSCFSSYRDLPWGAEALSHWFRETGPKWRSMTLLQPGLIFLLRHRQQRYVLCCSSDQSVSLLEKSKCHNLNYSKNTYMFLNVRRVIIRYLPSLGHDVNSWTLILKLLSSAGVSALTAELKEGSTWTHCQNCCWIKTSSIGSLK